MSASILLVDDDAWQLGIYERAVAKAGCAHRSAQNPAEAIAHIQQKMPDAIVLDVLLEGNTAFVLLNELRSDAELANIPVILATNLADDLRLRDLEPYGVRRIINKMTAHPSDIAAAIKAVLL